VAPSKLRLGSGVGLVVADMVGTGVLTTAGFMAADLSPRLILLDWAVGGGVALSGALAYAALARQVPRSGGEYRYLSALLHPAAGYVAGWASLLVGFSVPVALAALAAGAFAETVVPGLPPRSVAVALIAVTTGLHAVGLPASKRTQDALAAVKALLLAAFIAIGLAAGTNVLPAWTPAGATDGFPLAAFFTSLVFIMFCYSGWNATVYAAEEFAHPRRDVPRAMVIGCLLVTGVYLLVNWVFVTNLTQADLAAWIGGDTDRITLAHLVLQKLIGPGTAKVMSAVIVVALASAISAMTLIGPRVYAAMALDGLLPRALVAREGRPPVGAIVLQGGLATSLLFLAGFRELLTNVSSILAVVSAATVLSLFRASRWRAGERPGLPALGGALVFAGMSAWMVGYAVRSSRTVAVVGLAVPSVLLWMVAVVAVAMVEFALTRRAPPAAPAEPVASDV
jgi:basic amino acid/polyamine antiporter, APA family